MTEPCMVPLAEAFLASRRKCGFDLLKEAQRLLSFARYADGIGHSGTLTTDLAVQWARLTKTGNPIYWARRLDVVRRFARHLRLIDPRTEIPPKGLLGPSYRRLDPYIYSEAEIAALLAAATKLPPMDGLRPKTFTSIFGLLASTGLRISEALRLTRPLADLNAGVLTIVETKFRKSRLVPLHPSTTQALRSYTEIRDRYLPLAQAKEFFLSDLGMPLKYGTVRQTFARLRRRLGWVGVAGRRSPRIHDLRHTFVCRRLLGWYQEGAEVDLKVPALSTYLGHAGVSTSYWYFTAVPDLMAAAAARFERGAETPR